MKFEGFISRFQDPDTIFSNSTNADERTKNEEVPARFVSPCIDAEARPYAPPSYGEMFEHAAAGDLDRFMDENFLGGVVQLLIDHVQMYELFQANPGDAEAFRQRQLRRFSDNNA